jgi:hypothetical protein
VIHVLAQEPSAGYLIGRVLGTLFVLAIIGGVIVAIIAVSTSKGRGRARQQEQYWAKQREQQRYGHPQQPYPQQPQQQPEQIPPQS